MVAGLDGSAALPTPEGSALGNLDGRGDSGLGSGSGRAGPSILSSPSSRSRVSLVSPAQRLFLAGRMPPPPPASPSYLMEASPASLPASFWLPPAKGKPSPDPSPESRTSPLWPLLVGRWSPEGSAASIGGEPGWSVAGWLPKVQAASPARPLLSLPELATGRMKRVGWLRFLCAVCDRQELCCPASASASAAPVAALKLVVELLGGAITSLAAVVRFISQHIRSPLRAWGVGLLWKGAGPGSRQRAVSRGTGRDSRLECFLWGALLPPLSLSWTGWLLLTAWHKGGLGGLLGRSGGARFWGLSLTGGAPASRVILGLL
mmetsp:Transcript_9466/g.27023  ORF Transcript_9466/g.27023 Transcript_9466/m.27023 type:complete len:319 (-) Transcript_9466:137-1093(-)